MNPCQHRLDPPLEWSTVDALVSKFEGIVRGYCDPELLSKVVAAEEEGGGEDGHPDAAGHVRRLVKHVADIVWNTLSKSHYKDRSGVANH